MKKILSSFRSFLLAASYVGIFVLGWVFDVPGARNVLQFVIIVTFVLGVISLFGESKKPDERTPLQKSLLRLADIAVILGLAWCGSYWLAAMDVIASLSIWAYYASYKEPPFTVKA